MSLQVWLPLNGKLDNLGLDGSLKFTNDASATVSTEGKIGSCYSFSATSGSGIYLSSGKSASEFMNTYINHHSWSMCAWIKTTSNDNVVFGLTYGLRLWCGSTNQVSLYNKTRAVSASNNISTIDGKWHHICATYNTVDNAINVYVDGIKGTTVYYPSGETYASSWTNTVAIGRDPNNSTASAHYYFQGSMNDARIYDHCLSTEEVKELSKGMIGHWKLDNKGFGNPNLCPLTSKQDWTALNTKNYYSILSTSTSNFGLSVGDTFTWSVYVKVPTEIKKLRARVQFYNSGSDRTGPTGSTYVINGEGRISVTGTILSGYTEMHLCIDYNASSDIATTNVECYYKMPKLEKGSKVTSWIPYVSDPVYSALGLDSATEFDGSGLSNNGTKIGGLSISTSPQLIRYDNCYTFDGSTGSIQIPNLATMCPSGEFTMNCWIYHDNTWSSKTWETIFGGPSGFELEAKSGSTNSPVLYAYSWGKGTATYELNKWNMITMTRNASETKFYINGELKITGSAGTIPSGNYFIGAWSNSSGQNYKGQISDFRLYATVLSVDDIKRLYDVSASIDKSGNIFAYSFKEE